MLTGYVTGFDLGLIGAGAIHMAGKDGEIECSPEGQCDSDTMPIVKAMLSRGNNVMGQDNACAVGQACTVAGVCEGMDVSGMIRLWDCRAIDH